MIDQPAQKKGTTGLLRILGVGFGVAMLSPLYWAAELATGRLVQPFETLYLPGSALWLVHPAGRVGVRKIERFREWIHQELAGDRGLVPAEVWEPQ